MKKLFIASLAIFLSFMLCACGSEKVDPSPEQNTTDVTRENTSTQEINTTENTGSSEKETEETTETKPVEDKYKVDNVADFNRDGYAWIVVSKNNIKNYALLNHKLDICCILPFNYDDIAKIHPFELDFDGNGSTLVEMRSGEKHIINENGDITYTLDKDVYDDLLFGSKGYYQVSKVSSGYDDFGTDYGIINANGEAILPLFRADRMQDVGSGVFAITIFNNLHNLSFYYCKNNSFFFIDGFPANYFMLNNGDLFVDSIAKVELGSGRMGDPVALTDAETRETTQLHIKSRSEFYDYGPIADNGFVYYSYSYEGNRGDIVTSIMFYDFETGTGYSIFDDPERIKYDSIKFSSDELKFIDGYLALELLGADGNTYFAVVNKSGETVYGPTKDISRIENLGEGYFLAGNELINVDGKVPLSGMPHISTFSHGYAVAEFGEYYVDINGNRVNIDIEDK